LSKATVFFSGENKWRKFNQWPAANCYSQLHIYLKKDGNKLSFNPGSKVSGRVMTAYVSDPAKPVPYTQRRCTLNRTREYMTDDQRFAARRTDVLVYEH
jgi:predicted acyl esterase